MHATFLSQFPVDHDASCFVIITQGMGVEKSINVNNATVESVENAVERLYREAPTSQ
jgi:hypothetical protein